MTAHANMIIPRLVLFRQEVLAESGNVLLEGVLLTMRSHYVYIHVYMYIQIQKDVLYEHSHAFVLLLCEA